MDDYKKVFGNKQTILVVMAHPDDLEVFCGGTVARLLADGKRVISVKVTTGNRGSKDQNITAQELAATRLREDQDAMKSLGIPPEHSVNLGFNDGEVENSPDLIEKLAYQMRKFQPDLVITTNPEHVIIRHSQGVNWVNHRDHRNTASSALDAAYPYSRDRAFFPDHFIDKNITSSKCVEFLIADSWDGIDEVLILVEGFVDQKLAAMKCHASQVDAQAAQESVDFFTRHEGLEGLYEKFRYVIAD